MTVPVRGRFRGGEPASRVAMDTSSLLVAFVHPLTLRAPAPKHITSDEFNMTCIIGMIVTE